MTDNYLVLDAWGNPVYGKLEKEWSVVDSKVLDGYQVHWYRDEDGEGAVPNAKETYARDDKTTAYIQYDSKDLDGTSIRFLMSNLFINYSREIRVKLGASLRHPKDAFDRKIGNALARKDSFFVTLKADVSTFQYTSYEDGTSMSSLGFLETSITGNKLRLTLSWQFHSQKDNTVSFRSSPQIERLSFETHNGPSVDFQSSYIFS